MQKSLSPKTITVIKNSATLITKNDTNISKKMYEILFLKHPELEKIFLHKSPDQYMRLAETLSAYAINIDRIEKLQPALQAIAESHVMSKVKPSYYPTVGMILIEAIENILGDSASIEFIDAWREAYKFIANILIEMEQEIRESAVVNS